MQTEQRTRHAHRATAPIANTLPLHATRCIVDVKVLVWKPWRSLYAATMERLRSGADSCTHRHAPRPCGGLVLPFMSTRMTTRVPWH